MNPARLREPDGDPQYRVAVEFDVFADNLIEARGVLDAVTAALAEVDGLADVRMFARFASGASVEVVAHDPPGPKIIVTPHGPQPGVASAVSILPCNQQKAISSK